MSNTIGQPSNAQSQLNESKELLSAALSKGQQEKEGELALQLIKSADTTNQPSPTGNSGHQINIKV